MTQRQLYTTDGKRMGPWAFKKQLESQVIDQTRARLRTWGETLDALRRDLATLEGLHVAHKGELRLEPAMTNLRARISVLTDRRDSLYRRTTDLEWRLAARVKARWAKHWGEEWKGAGT